MAIQGPLNGGYNGDRYLGNRMQERIDVPAIREFLKDQPAKMNPGIDQRGQRTFSSHPDHRSGKCQLGCGNKQVGRWGGTIHSGGTI